ncbi:hypothetical protein EOPP23_00220 [Endozoicomonas sp. OPT23]|uniref:hypothetical protein n=1 Tax=Endozoicomonas sp. OPT23 TaxID=2072845 RepID=UPI00129A32C2|nr:hypothetical protein [Endozoicomonas sp. OPT23]MRI31413.1 hypothetical protein [Endozoicomonas sp. OPT23]
MQGVEPYSSRSFRDFYDDLKGKGENVADDYPIYEEGKLSVEKRGYLFGPTESKHSAFCRTVEHYITRENELLSKPALERVNHWDNSSLTEEYPFLKEVKSRSADVVQPNMTMESWQQLSKSISSSSISELQDTEVELMKAVMDYDPNPSKKKESEALIKKKTEALINEFCRITHKRDPDWEQHLHEFLDSEAADIRNMWLNHCSVKFDTSVENLKEEFDNISDSAMSVLNKTINELQHNLPASVLQRKEYFPEALKKPHAHTKKIVANRLKKKIPVEEPSSQRPTRVHYRLADLSKLPLATVMAYTRNYNVSDIGHKNLAGQMKAYEAVLSNLQKDFGIGREGFQHIISNPMMDSSAIRALKRDPNSYTYFKMGFEIVKAMKLLAPKDEEEYEIFLDYMAKTQSESSVLMSLQVRDQPTPDLTDLKQRLETTAVSAGEPDRAMSPAFNAHGQDEATFEEALAEKLKELDHLKEFQNDTEFSQQQKATEIILKFRYGQLTREAATAEIKKQCSSAYWQTHITTLNHAFLIRPVLVTQEEHKELEVFNDMIETLYEHQLDGNSNCQSFANSLECFFRTGKYQPVISVNAQIDIPYNNSETSPVVGWYLTDDLGDPVYKAQFQNDVEGFFKAAFTGQTNKGADQKRSALKALDCDRYIIHKQTPGGGGHYLYMLRMKSSGRFVILDPQNQQMYPLLHPDGTPTTEARADFDDRTIHIHSPECMNDQKFAEELEKSHKCLSADHKFGTVTGIYEKLKNLPEECWDSIEKSAKWLSSNITPQVSEQKIAEALNASPGPKLWPVIWNGGYLLHVPAEISALQLRVETNKPRTSAEVRRFIVDLLPLIPASERANRSSAYKAINAMRNKEAAVSLYESKELPQQKLQKKTAFEQFCAMKPLDTKDDQFPLAMEHLLGEEGCTEADIDYLFPTEEIWLSTCGPEVDLTNGSSLDAAYEWAEKKPEIKHPETMKGLMEKLKLLSEAARTSRAVAAGELASLIEGESISKEEIEADLSLLFSESAWSNNWSTLTNNTFIIPDYMKNELIGRSPKAMIW